MQDKGPRQSQWNNQSAARALGFELGREARGASIAVSSLAHLSRQRSHLVLVQSNPGLSQESEFVAWYQGSYLKAVSSSAGVVRARHYEQHEVDITRGRYARPSFRYLGIYELSIDGAEQAAPLIDLIEELHRREQARRPATWVYYPVSDKVGRDPTVSTSMLTIAFANGVVGKEAEFREWYATRHIRHALNVPALVSGQCFERCLFQRPGAAEPVFCTIAIYEQEGSPEDIIHSFVSLPEGTLSFPTLDRSPGRFAEWVYQPLRVP